MFARDSLGAGWSTVVEGPLLRCGAVSSPADRVIERLAALLGPTAARSTLETFCLRTLGVKPEALLPAQMPAVLPAFKPLLSVLIGSARAHTVIQDLLEEFKS